jgi:RHH-type rel operon transcriptional repressor/antitoxin RelB
LDDLEDLYLAEQRLIDIRAGHSRTHTLEEVERDLGLAD